MIKNRENLAVHASYSHVAVSEYDRYLVVNSQLVSNTV